MFLWPECFTYEILLLSYVIVSLYYYVFLQASFQSKMAREKECTLYSKQLIGRGTQEQKSVQNFWVLAGIY